jgi:hypothetical protein
MSYDMLSNHPTAEQKPRMRLRSEKAALALSDEAVRYG